MQTKDFDRFMAEREDGRMRLRILGRDCEVPRELPWHYMLKVERTRAGRSKKQRSAR